MYLLYYNFEHLMHSIESLTGYRLNRICMWILAIRGQRCEKRKSNQSISNTIPVFTIITDDTLTPEVYAKGRVLCLRIESSISGYWTLYVSENNIVIENTLYLCIHTYSCMRVYIYILYMYNLFIYTEDGDELIYYNLAIIIIILS